MMGGQSSKSPSSSSDNPPPPPLPPLSINTNSHLTSDLNSYESACRTDPQLQSTDSTVYNKVNRILTTLAIGPEARTLSFDALVEVTDFLLDSNLDVARVIMEYREGIWNNKDMFDLVKEYFDNSLKTLDFCTALENCLKRSGESQLMIKLALQNFEEEETENKNKYGKTLEELKRFHEAGDPFTEEFVVLFQSVYQQQLAMFKKLQLQKQKLDKKFKSLKTWRKVSNVIFIVTFASVLIFSVMAAAMAAPPVVTALAAALAVPIDPIGKWCNMLWNKYLSEVNGQRELIGSMQGHTFIVLRDFESVRMLIRRLEVEIRSVLEYSDLAVKEGEDSVNLVVGEIKKRLEVFEETVDNLSRHAGRCSRDIMMARTVILEKIVRQPNH